MAESLPDWDEYRRSNPPSKTEQDRLPVDQRPRVAEHYRKLKYMKDHRPACGSDWLAFRPK